MNGEHSKVESKSSKEQLIQYLRVSLELAEKSDGLAYIASVPLKQVIELLEGAAVETKPSRNAGHCDSNQLASLIEVEIGGRPHFWKASADARCVGEFDPDPNAALRLCREKDARDLAVFLGAKGTIALADMSRVSITEHEWPVISGDETACDHAQADARGNAGDLEIYCSKCGQVLRAAVETSDG